MHDSVPRYRRERDGVAEGGCTFDEAVGEVRVERLLRPQVEGQAGSVHFSALAAHVEDIRAALGLEAAVQRRHARR